MVRLCADIVSEGVSLCGLLLARLHEPSRWSRAGRTDVLTDRARRGSRARAGGPREDVLTSATSRLARAWRRCEKHSRRS
ncbi:hypothetical protein GN956_G11736 [Arapaima gigas]